MTKINNVYCGDGQHVLLFYSLFYYYIILLLCPGRGTEYCEQFVCLSVREHVSGTAGPTSTKLFAQIPCGRGSVFLWWRYDMLYTSGFTDDVTFGRNGPYGDSGVVIRGRSLMSMNALLFLFHYPPLCQLLT